MKRVRKLVAVLLSMTMLLCLVAGGVEAAAETAYSTKSFPNAKRYTYRYNSGKVRDYDGVAYYTDDYFTLDPTASVPNMSLATASYSLSLAAMNSNEAGENYQENDKNLKDFLKKLGYKNYRANEEFRIRPMTDSIGVGVAQKKVSGKDYTVIAVGIRGAGYGAEWGGNFQLGRYGEHSDFAQNRDKVLKFLKQYIKKQKITGHVKIWMAGYSRGGAVGNLVGAAIDEGALKDTGIKYGKKDLYAFNFEPPQGAMASKDLQNARYDNIWNFINVYDIAPLCAMKEYGFGRYGRVWNYPTRGKAANYESQRKQMEKLFYAMTSHEVPETYCADSFIMYKFDPLNGGIVENPSDKTTLPEFNAELMRILSEELVGSRDNYVDHYQNGFRIALSYSEGDRILSGEDSGFLEALRKNLKEESMARRLARAAATPYDTTYGFNNVVRFLVVESLNDAGFNDVAPVELSSFVECAVKLIAGLFLFEPDYAVTAVENASKLFNVHYPEVSYAWLMLKDPNYHGTADCL